LKDSSHLDDILNLQIMHLQQRSNAIRHLAARPGWS